MPITAFNSFTDGLDPSRMSVLLGKRRRSHRASASDGAIAGSACRAVSAHTSDTWGILLGSARRAAFHMPLEFRARVRSLRRFGHDICVEAGDSIAGRAVLISFDQADAGRASRNSSR